MCKLMKRLLVFLLTVFMLVGCINDSSITPEVSEDEIKENAEVSKEVNTSETRTNTEKEGNSIKSVINDKLNKEFQVAIPNAEVIDKTMFDITNDGVKDLIVIYDTNEQKSNFAIVSKEGFNAITLNGEDTNFQFANGKYSLRFLENPHKMIITLFDPDKNLTVDFEILMEYNKEKNETNIIIKSKEVK